ncbi:L-galactono-1,4-lactone dehydrogenase 1, mitochondrial [Apostasia shenzhenica]|uniref:L-gulonolactone oxidase n=1 Tax=Apostasia shenzhenica TaxID=1088818 RepID=A0A2I0AER9_9ASPA|nr:L-galactono-1,4-lactone dehydrogenase 1, mitochondrial [Apostasia shenzhenica]
MEPGSILTAGAQALARALLAALLFAAAARSSPPESPIKCDSGNSNCTITNSYGAYPDRSTCRFARAVFPATEAELVAAVAAAVREGRKMKAATRYAHSIPKLSCPGGDEGVVISTRELNHIVGVNSSAMEMTVESGVVLRDLIKAAAGSGLALLYAPYWAGVTVGGILGTGAHGSSLWGKGSAVHDYVVGARIVTPASPAEGYAVVRSLDAGNPDLDAVKVSLGVLGIISQVTLKLQPLFSRSVTYVKRSDAGLAAAAVTFGSQYEFADIKWFPGSRQAFFRQDSRASSNALGNGLYDYIGFRRTITAGLALERTTEETLEAVGDAGGKCTVAQQINGALSVAAYGLTNDGVLFTGYPVVGSQHRMQTSGGCLKEADDGLLTACAWDPRVKGKFYHQTTFTVALPKVRDFIADVQKLRELQPNGLCTVELYDGILLRYVRASTAFLGKEEDGIDFDVTYYRSRDPLTPRLYEDVLEEIEQMAVFKYGALPHWGKNRNAAFAGVNAKYAKMGEFLAVKGRYDPQGFFSSEWTDQILGIAGSPKIETDGCALEGLCVCSDDRHCAPANGYLCRPGKVYKEARVCTRVNN